MSNSLAESLPPSELHHLARSFSRLGRIGFWMQAVVGTMLLILMGYFFLFARSPSGPRAGLAIVEYLTAGGLLILIFTTLWFYRYIRLARRLADPPSCPPGRGRDPPGVDGPGGRQHRPSVFHAGDDH